MNNDERKENRILERLDRIETDVYLIKEINILANEKLFLERLRKAIGKSKNKARILYSCYSKSKTQIELSNELVIAESNLSYLIKELSKSRMIYPLKIGKSKLIQPTFDIRKQLLLDLLNDIFGEEFSSDLIQKYG